MCPLRRQEEPAAFSQEATETHQMKEELARLKHENAELRSALREACMSTLPPEAAQYVQVGHDTAPLSCTLYAGLVSVVASQEKFVSSRGVRSLKGAPSCPCRIAWAAI